MTFVNILDVIWSTIANSYWDIGTGVGLCPLNNYVTYKIMFINKTKRIQWITFSSVYHNNFCVFPCHIKPQQTTSLVTFDDPQLALTNKTMNREKVFKYSSDIYVWWLSLPCHLYKSLRRPYLERSKSTCFVSNVKTMP